MVSNWPPLIVDNVHLLVYVLFMKLKSFKTIVVWIVTVVLHCGFKTLMFEVLSYSEMAKLSTAKLELLQE